MSINCLAKDKDVVFITAKSKQYHYKDCKILSKSKIIYSITIKEAVNRGYSACKICNPPIAKPEMENNNYIISYK